MKSDLTAEELPKYFRANVFAQLLDELDPLFTCNGRRALSDIFVRADGTSVEIEFTLKRSRTKPGRGVAFTVITAFNQGWLHGVRS